MTFSTAKPQMPECFRQKIEIDKQIEDALAPKIVSWYDIRILRDAIKNLRTKQATIRNQCEMYIKRVNGP